MTMTISEALTVIANAREQFYDAGDSCSGHDLADALSVIRSRLEVSDEMFQAVTAFMPLARGSDVCEDIEFHAYDIARERVEAALVAALRER